MELPQVCEVSNLEASIFSLLGSYLNPIVIPKLMAERGTKRGIIRSVSLWPMSLAPTNGGLVCDAEKNLHVGRN